MSESFKNMIVLLTIKERMHRYIFKHVHVCVFEQNVALETLVFTKFNVNFRYVFRCLHHYHLIAKDVSKKYLNFVKWLLRVSFTTFYTNIVPSRANSCVDLI